MTVYDQDPNQRPEDNYKNIQPKRRFILSGLFLLTAGIVLILQQMDYIIPDWVISWQTLLIFIGIYIGEKHHFSNPGFFIPILIGSVFLIDEIWPNIPFRHFFWPIILICAGLFLMMKPRRNGNWYERKKNFKRRRYENINTNRDTNEGYFSSSEDYLDCVSIFGGTKKNITNKNFKGGEATSIFGGTEINLMNADITGKVVLDLTQIFGGCKLIVPSHWEIKSELINIFGGVEDKRPMTNLSTDPTKVLVLNGTSFFGGIEIKSF